MKSQFCRPLLVASALLVGGLCATTANASEHRTLTKPILFQCIPYVGGNDADVYTQPGRYTHVIVIAHHLTIDRGGETLRISVTYDVQEGASQNGTHLSRTDVIVLAAPEGCRIVSASPSPRKTGLRKTFPGRDHSWHDESATVEGSYFSELNVKFDGEGPDDKGNAQMEAVLVIPVLVECE